MAKFVFNLDPLLRQRVREQERRQRDLALANAQRQSLETELAGMQNTITDSKHALAGGLVGKIDLTAVATYARYSGQVTARAHGMVRKIARADQTMQAARQALVEANRHVKALETIREKRKAQWQQTHDRRETAELDEAAAQAYVRKQSAAIRAAKRAASHADPGHADLRHADLRHTKLRHTDLSRTAATLRHEVKS